VHVLCPPNGGGLPEQVSHYYSAEQFITAGFSATYC